MATTSALTESQKKQKILEVIKKNHPNLSGEQWHTFSKALDIAHLVAGGLEALPLPVAEAIVEVFAHTSARAAAASHYMGVLAGPLVSLVGGLALAYCMFNEILKASKTSLRLYEMRAIAFTITAWAFNDPIPARSEAHLKEIKRNPYTGGYSVADHELGWQRVSAAAKANLERQTGQTKYGKLALQSLLRAIGNNNREDLCDLFLVAFESKLESETEKKWWREMYKKAYYPK